MYKHMWETESLHFAKHHKNKDVIRSQASRFECKHHGGSDIANLTGIRCLSTVVVYVYMELCAAADMIAVLVADNM